MNETRSPMLSADVRNASPAHAYAALDAALQRRNLTIDDVVRFLDKTGDELQFHRELLRATLEHLSQGVSVVDNEFRLVSWNRRYIEIFEYPPGLITFGRPIAEVIRFNAERGLIGSHPEIDTDTVVERRIDHMRQGNSYTHERELPNGRVIEIRGKAMPGGGFVTSYSDITAYKQAQHDLETINETLEQRVAERTAELVRANQALSDANQALSEAKLTADRANQAKSRFLASASHDLVQPLNAARLFVSTIDRRRLPDTESRLISQVEDSLTSAESLLGALLDISRLDAVAQELRSEHFPLRNLMQPLSAEFAALARTRGLDFRVVPTDLYVNTDPRLLRRVLQNFLSNAIRYTRSGKVLLGCRRLPGHVRIEVWDTGPGIPEGKQQEIFEEFRRLENQGSNADRGLGLGLAIAERLARLMNHPLGLRSWPGQGSVFSITVPLGDARMVATPMPTGPRVSSDRVAGSLMLCIDNEPAVLAGMQSLLGNWGAEAIGFSDVDSALAFAKSHKRVPDLMLVDYHLDSDRNGIEAVVLLRKHWRRNVPGIIITADHTQAAQSAAESHGMHLLRKPLKPAALRALINRQLSEAS